MSAPLPVRSLVRRAPIDVSVAGVAYLHLKPGAQPIVKSLQQWPGQNVHNTDAKTPTAVFYSSEEGVCSFGAEAIRVAAEGQPGQLVQHFKMRLHSDTTFDNDRDAASEAGSDHSSLYDVMTGELVDEKGAPPGYK